MPICLTIRGTHNYLLWCRHNCSILVCRRLLRCSVISQFIRQDLRPLTTVSLIVFFRLTINLMPVILRTGVGQMVSQAINQSNVYLNITASMTILKKYGYRRWIINNARDFMFEYMLMMFLILMFFTMGNMTQKFIF